MSGGRLGLPRPTDAQRSCSHSTTARLLTLTFSKSSHFRERSFHTRTDRGPARLTHWLLATVEDGARRLDLVLISRVPFGWGRSWPFTLNTHLAVVLSEDLRIEMGQPIVLGPPVYW
jgi:hypothetical protein